jgi:hypothetical protein
MKNKSFNLCPLMPVFCLFFAAPATQACTNLKDFKGQWNGTIHQDEAVRAGFPENTELTLDIAYVNPRRLEGTVTTCVRDSVSDICEPGHFDNTPLVPLEKAQNDDLKSITFGGEPYAVFLMTLQPTDPQQEPMLVFVSLHSSERVEVRILRGQTVFGVFRLTRPDEL